MFDAIGRDNCVILHYDDGSHILHYDDGSHTEGVYVQQPGTTPYPSFSNGLGCIVCMYAWYVICDIQKFD